MGDPRDIRAFSGRERTGGYLAINTQQDKMLEQMKRSLDSEKQYALRTIEGDKNIMRARHLRFRNKVSKIKSHLTEEQILELQQGEASVRVSKSHLGFSSTTAANGVASEAEKHRSHSASGRLQTRSVSTSVEAVAKENQSGKRVPRPVLVKHQQVYSPVSELESLSEEEDLPPQTAGRRSSKANGKVSIPSTPRKSLSTFSCHDITVDEDGRAVASCIQSGRASTNSWTSNESPEEKLRQEFRQMLLGENERRLAICQENTSNFLHKVAYDMQREKREQEERERQIARERAEQLEAERYNSKAAKLKRMREDIRKKKLDRMKRGHDNEQEDMLERKEGESDAEYEERMANWREEMKRIRYLRQQRGSQDVADVVTLVTAGMAANKIWREGLAHDLI